MHKTVFKRVDPNPYTDIFESDNIVRIVSATRGSLQEFQQTALGKTLQYHSQLFDFELFVQEFNNKPLPEVYNQVIELSRDDPATLVFVHDDVMILDLYWLRHLHQSLEIFDVVGIVGTTRRLPNQCSWCFTDKLGQWHDRQYFSGRVACGWPPDGIMTYGPTLQRCQLLDAFFLAVHSEKLISSGLRFDPRFDFHFYDLDFCRQAEVLDISMGTTDISVLHLSSGVHDDNWHTLYRTYLEKWKT